jgi:hypothetical protein
MMALAGSFHAELETRRTKYHLSSPNLVHDGTRRQFPLIVRFVLGILGAHHFLRVSASAAIPSTAIP